MRLSTIAFVMSLASGLCPTMLNQARAEVALVCFDQTDATNCMPRVDIQPARTAGSTYDQLYRAYAELAWQDFLALSLPDSGDLPQSGGPQTPRPKPHLGYYATAKKENRSYIPKWLKFISATDLFPSDGNSPRKFAASALVPKECQALNAGNLPVLDEYFQANRMGPVIDQSKNYLRFGIGFNEVMYNYVVSHHLYYKKGQVDFDARDKKDGQRIKWDLKVNWPSKLESNNGTIAGSIFVKSAWKIIEDADKDEYLMIDAYIYTPQSDNLAASLKNPKTVPFIGETRVAEPECLVKKVALVGLHIVHRTPSAPQWVWATFEHKDNAPWIDELSTGTHAAGPERAFSLFNSNSNKCLLQNGQFVPECNELPKHPWDPRLNTSNSKPEPSQVVRSFRPGLKAAEVNAEMTNPEKKGHLDSIPGPWKNYFLVDVQFPTVVKHDDKGNWSENPAYPDGMPTPSFLANSTMETYVQGLLSGQTSNGNEIPTEDRMQLKSGHGISGGAVRVTSSCVSCHYDATTTTGTNSNFVFSLSRAKEQIKAAR